MIRRMVIAAAGLAVAACSTRVPQVRTVVLGPAADSGSVFEPAAAVDPADPVRMAVGAQYGEGYNRGGLRFFVWTSVDGGESWDGREAVPGPLRGDPTMAADLSLAYDTAGSPVMFGIHGDSVRFGVPEAALALADLDEDSNRFRPRLLAGRSVDLADRVFEVSDKPWLAIDRRPASPFRGALYATWTVVRVNLVETPPDITRRLVLARLDEAPSGEPVVVAGEGMGAQMAVQSDGSLELVWAGESEGAMRILHARSVDGGRSVSTPKVVRTLADSTGTLDLPSLAVDRRGGLLACWLEIPKRESRAVWCSRHDRSSRWSPPGPAFGEGETGSFAPESPGLPSVAFAGGAWRLLVYSASGDSTRVVLARSTGEGPFEVTDTLAARPLAAESFCASAMLPCRRDRSFFLPGDYVGLAASGDRLVAAYALPPGGDPALPAELVVSIIDY